MKWLPPKAKRHKTKRLFRPLLFWREDGEKASRGDPSEQTPTPSETPEGPILSNDGTVETQDRRCTPLWQPSPSPVATDTTPPRNYDEQAATPPSPSTYDMWEEALDNVRKTPKNEEILRCFEHVAGQDGEHAKDFKVSIVIQDISKKMDEEIQVEQNRRTRRIVRRTVSVLNMFSGAVDVVVSCDPVHAALPWAAVRLALRTLSASGDLKSHLLAGLAHVASLIVQCDMFHKLYMTVEHYLRPPTVVLDGLKKSIIQAYTASQLFLGFAIRLRGLHHLASLAAAPIKVGDAEDHVQELNKASKNLVQASDECDKHYTQSGQAKLHHIIDQVASIKQSIHEQQSITNEINLVVQHLGRAEQDKILDWVSTERPGEIHRGVENDRVPETCQWLLDHERFHEWQDSASSKVLWLQGSPGAGKTFLVSKAIDHVKAQACGSDENDAYAFFYFNRNEGRRNPLIALQSCVRQLSTTEANPTHMRKSLRDLYADSGRRGARLGWDDCERQLLECVGFHTRTTIVLDALDECEPDRRHRLVDMLERLLAQSTNPLKILISSRPDPDIKERFDVRPHIEIQATDNQDDIMRLVSQEISKHRRWNKLSRDLKDEILRVLHEKSNGMFQWASLQIKQLLSLQLEAAIRDRLGKLPPDLKSTYDEIYSEIEAGNELEKGLADRTLMWVMCTRGPLCTAGLVEAVRLDPDDDNAHAEKGVDEGLLLGICRNLLVVDVERDIWRFSHLSVAEYFEDRWSQAQADCLIAKTCLRYLMDRMEDDETKGDETGVIHSLFRYVVILWPAHVEAYELSVSNSKDGEKPDAILSRLLKRFLGSPMVSSPQYRKWFKSFYEEMRFLATYKGPLSSTMDIGPATVAIVTMCRLSLYSLLEDWWEKEWIDVLQENEYGHNVLSITAETGSLRILENLVRRGAKLDPPQLQHQKSSALVAAASRHIECVRFLVEQRADVNFIDERRFHPSPLAAAVIPGEIEIIKFLLESGADANMPLPGEYGNTLITAAANSANDETITILVNRGADTNCQAETGFWGTALIAAVFRGHIRILERLLDSRADANQQVEIGYFSSALVAAACRGRESCVKALIDAGADVNQQVKFGPFGSALVAAVCEGKKNCVDALINAGADVNQRVWFGMYGSALVAAACWGQESCAKVLIKAGADVNQRVESGEYGSALVASRTANDLASRAVDRVKVESLLRQYGAVD